MKRLIFSVFLFSIIQGCATVSKKKSGKQQFQGTGSFCLDSYILRSAADGCQDWAIREIEGVRELKCKKKSHGEKNIWTDSTFVFFQKSSNVPMIPSFRPICIDEKSVFGVISTERLK